MGPCHPDVQWWVSGSPPSRDHSLSCTGRTKVHQSARAIEPSGGGRPSYVYPRYAFIDTRPRIFGRNQPAWVRCLRRGAEVPHKSRSPDAISKPSSRAAPDLLLTRLGWAPHCRGQNVGPAKGAFVDPSFVITPAFLLLSLGPHTNNNHYYMENRYDAFPRCLLASVTSGPLFPPARNLERQSTRQG